MNKKIGILTLSAADNCGSLLQTYALQTYLKKATGLEVEVINFVYKQSKALYDIFPKNIWWHPRGLYPRICNYSALLKQKKDYQQFREKYIILSNKEYHTEDELSVIAKNYSIIVCGSDQVWNVNMLDFDNAFFLEWAKQVKKIAYAPSLGGGTLLKRYDEESMKKILSSFSAISVREEAGKQQTEAILDKEIDMVLDPTLLLSYEEWDSIVGSPMIKGNYIFFYSWAYCDDEINEIVAEYSRKRNLPVYVINASKWLERNPKKYGFNLFKSSGPETFLNLMKYANKVFVQSFHGVIFANIFKKDFYFLDEHKDGTLDPRLNSILTILDKKDRVARSYDEIDDRKYINYKKESQNLVNLKEISENFIKNNFDN